MSSATPIIHLADPQGRQTTHSPAQVADLIARGDLEPDTLFWTPGMEDWRPIAEFAVTQDNAVLPSSGPGGPLDTPLFHRQEKRGRPRFTIDPTGLTQIVAGLLILQMMMGVVGLWGDWRQIQALEVPDFDPQAWEANQGGQELIALGQLLAHLVGGLVFLKWLARATLNSQGFLPREAAPMRFSPTMAVVVWFIPFINLVRPYQVVADLFRIATNPADWSRQSAPPWLILWWLHRLACGVFAWRAMTALTEAKTPGQLAEAMRLSMASGVAGITVSLFGLVLVKALMNRQRALVESDRTDDLETSVFNA